MGEDDSRWDNHNRDDSDFENDVASTNTFDAAVESSDDESANAIVEHDHPYASDDSGAEIRNRRIIREWFGYMETAILFEISNTPSQPGVERLTRTYRLSMYGLKYKVNAQFKFYTDNKITTEPMFKNINTCCCSGIIINGEFNAHGLDSDYHNHFDQNAINLADCPYRSVSFCIECLSPIEKKCITKCYDGNCRKKPGVMQCVSYVFTCGDNGFLVPPIIVYSDPLVLCDTCAARNA